MLVKLATYNLTSLKKSYLPPLNPGSPIDMFFEHVVDPTYDAEVGRANLGIARRLVGVGIQVLFLLEGTRTPLVKHCIESCQICIYTTVDHGGIAR